MSFLVSLLLVLTRHRHGHLSMDHPGAVQKFHLEPTPRVGGIGIYLALALAWLLLDAGPARQLLGVILLAGLPALVFGLAEDMTKRVGVLPRLLATMVSGLVACLLSGVALNRLDVALLDSVLTYWPLAVMLTAFAVGGVANAVNIIDGFHGLASGTVILMLLALSAMAFQVGDAPLGLLGLLVAAAVTGFWLINYPWGKLFLGDGGAYFVGFALAWIAVLLPMRNPGVSPWASLLVCAYPITEVFYSVLRRSRQGTSPGDADKLHLHSLLASHFVQKHFPGCSNALQNACVAPFVWCFVAVPACMAIMFFDQTGLLMVGYLGAILVYHLTYRYLVVGRCPLVRPIAQQPPAAQRVDG
ncbi:glycosyltransferase [Rhodoferax sp.]|uniref:MraY family glycosyltransferase n=1 Tax=Rhodoferax sp. TaxID=50421 RepID=UPI0026169A58|nr:glycosyltransferase [Rhodoferax sp.]MDD2920249.1 glycosyltransferase [Rhodoferax sp.]